MTLQRARWHASPRIGGGPGGGCLRHRRPARGHRARITFAILLVAHVVAVMEAIAAQVQRNADVVAALELIRGTRVLRVRLVVAIVRIVWIVFAGILGMQVTDIDVIAVPIVIVIEGRTGSIVAYDALLIDGVAVGSDFVWICLQIRMHWGGWVSFCLRGVNKGVPHANRFNFVGGSKGFLLILKF